ncbi:MAG: hypothetical protein ACLFNX_11150 [Spirochaetaceae bacterium]
MKYRHENSSMDTGDSTVRVGEFLVSIGAMTEADVTRVLEEQAKRPYKLFGRIAIDLGLISDGAIDRYLAMKYPVAT